MSEVRGRSSAGGTTSFSRATLRFAIILALILVLLFPLSGYTAEMVVERPAPAVENSHQLYTDWLRGSGDAEFEKLVGRYDSHLSENPEDWSVGIERCRFIEGARLDEEGSSLDWEAAKSCRDELVSVFPGEPRVILYELDHRWGEEATLYADSLIDAGLDGWSDAEVAEIYGRTAWLYFDSGDGATAYELASDAFFYDPSYDVSAIRAEQFAEMNDEASAIEALAANLDTANSQRLSERLSQLISLEGYAEALDVIEHMKELDGHWVDEGLELGALYGAGQIEAARLFYAERLDRGEWMNGRLAAVAYRHELELGNAAKTLAAYQTLTEADWSWDVFGRQRVVLARTFPEMAWRAGDFRGLLYFIFFLLAMSLVPAIFVLPIHYFGLLRGRAKRPDFQGESRWKLWHFWYVSALIWTTSMIAAFVFDYPMIEEITADFDQTTFVSNVAVPFESSPTAFGMLMMGLMVMGTLVLVRRNDLKAWFRSDWAWRRAAVMVLVAIVCVRVISVINVGAAKALGFEVSLLLPGITTNQWIGEMITGVGLWATVFCVAVVVPIYEEIQFRAIILSVCSRYLNFGWANFAQAMFFAINHEYLVLLPFYVCLGLALGWLRRASDGLLVPIIFHGFHNAIVVMMIALVG